MNTRMWKITCAAILLVLVSNLDVGISSRDGFNLYKDLLLRGKVDEPEVEDPEEVVMDVPKLCNLEKEAIKRVQCSLGLIHDADCPLDGGWSLWSAWGSCEGECGQVGHRTRYRTCSVPPPANGGSTCHGSSSETEACGLKGCSQDEYQKLVQGDVLRETQFAVMMEVHREVPLLVEQCLVEECSYETVQETLKDTSMQYWTALHCVKHNIGCPVKGGWSHWTSWSSCTAACGLGSKFRQRNCSNPTPSEPDLACAGPQLQQEGCAGVGCSPYQRGEWSSWEPWTECSVKCGSGLHSRVRQCLMKTKRESSPEDDGSTERKKTLHSECKGPDMQMEECLVKDCNVDGGWSAWEDWEPCSQTCGAGAQSRSRSCSNPVPQGAGSKCSGEFTEVQHCFMRPCSVKSHHVAALDGAGVLLYSSSGTPSRMLHMYLRFLSTSLYGTIVHRHPDSCMGASCDYVTLSLEAGYVILSVQVSGCSATIISQNKLSLGEWHEVLLTVTGTGISVRIDDDTQRIHGKFNCVPLLPRLDHSMRVGEMFHGLIERITVNYQKLSLMQEKHKSSALMPYGSAHVIYEFADQEEGTRFLRDHDIVEIPCPSQQWLIEVSVKLQKPAGLILYIPGDEDDDFVVITVQDNHVKLQCRVGDNYTSLQNKLLVQQNTWLSVNLQLEEEVLKMSVNGGRHTATQCISPTCKGDMLLGDIPEQIKSNLKSPAGELKVEPLEAALGSVSVGSISLDLRMLPLEEEDGTMFSSRSSSTAELYDELPTLKGQEVNMSCLYEGKVATWLRLDVPLDEDGVKYSIKDDGKRSQLTLTSYSSREDVEDFYICWVRPRGGVPHVLVAYGVSIVEPDREFNSEPVAVFQVIGMAAAVVCFVCVVMLAFLYHRDKRNKHSTVLDNMLLLIQSEKAKKILGSEEQVKESKLQALNKSH